MLSPGFQSPIFRHDQPNIIAKNPQRANIDGVALAYDSGGYVAGQVLAKNSTSGLYQKYSDNASSGVGTAVCVLLDNLRSDYTTAASGDVGTQFARGVFGGEVFKDNLTGLDADAVTDLGGRTYSDFAGNNILTF